MLRFWSCLLLALTLGVLGADDDALAARPDPKALRKIDSRRELFVDDFLIDQLQGLELKMHPPVPHDVAIVCDAPWEGNTSAYYTLFQDGDVFRMYYRGAHFDVTTKKEAHPEVTCYAESRDGLQWDKPKLGLFEFNGSKDNNIVWNGPGTHNFTPFKDTSPACTAEARYKALAVNGKGLLAFQSPDGIHWSLLHDKPVITNGAFDSQNLAMWDDLRGEYRAYWRYFTDGLSPDKKTKVERVRAIRTATSQDFIHWENETDLEYGSAPAEHLYTNAIRMYARAPHLFVGFPTRFQPKNQQVEPVLMTSRDGIHFRRWPEPLIPITAPQDRDGNRSNYMTSGLLQLPGQDGELSVYASEAYYEGPGSRLRRFTFRTDGFVSLHAGQEPGTMQSRPLLFTGDKLLLNYVAHKAGSVRVELQDATGKPLPGYTLADCEPLTGDALAQPVTWNTGKDLSPLANQAIRLHFSLQNADVYALQFVP